jgi:putative tricarboxylic transport membrane protein
VAAFGIAGAIFMALDFPVSPIVLGFVLGPMLEENFRRAMLLSHGDLGVFVSHPISATFLAISSLLVLVQLFAYFRKIRITPPPGQTGAWMTR